jgi:carbonic anhydrase/acetyltransferase-like protein (isoleucine patch superfamily)
MKNVTIFIALRVVLLTIIVHAFALVLPLAIIKMALTLFSPLNALRAIFVSFIMVADAILLLLCCTLMTGFAARVFKLQYGGSHHLSARVPAVRRWLYHMAVYFPTAVALDLLHLYPLKTLHTRLSGALIGKNVVLAGLILDPCLCTIEEGSHIGGFSVIFGHSAEAERAQVVFAPVRIGKHCAVGARSMIMPGSRMEDGARLGPQSVLLTGQTLAAHTLYLGVPARRILETKPQDRVTAAAEVCAHE